MRSKYDLQKRLKTHGPNVILGLVRVSRERFLYFIRQVVTTFRINSLPTRGRPDTKPGSLSPFSPAQTRTAK